MFTIMKQPDYTRDPFSVKLSRNGGFIHFSAVTVAIGLLYVVLGKLSLFASLPPVNIAVTWLPSGVAAAAVLLYGVRGLPGILLGAAILVFVHGDGFLGPIVFEGRVLGEAVLIIAGAGLFAHSSNPFVKTTDVVVFLLISAGACFITSVLGILMLRSLGYMGWEAFHDYWWRWWLSDSAGIVIVTPITVFLCREKDGVATLKGMVGEMIILLVILFAAAFLVLSDPLSLDVVQELPYVLMIFLLWAAFRMGSLMTVFVSICIAVMAFWGALHDSGPFVGHDLGHTYFSMQVYIWILGATGLIVSTLMREQKAIQASLTLSDERFRTALKNSFITVATQDGDLRYTWIYNAPRGMANDEFIGQKDSEIFPDDGGHLLEKMKEEVMVQGIGISGQVETRICGERAVYSVTIDPVVDDGGRRSGVMSAMANITDRKKAEEEMDRRNRELIALSQMSATLNRTLDIQNMAESALDTLIHLDMFRQRPGGIIFLTSQWSDEFRPVAHRGMPEELPCLVTLPKMGHCACGVAIQENRVIVSHDTTGDGHFENRCRRTIRGCNVCIPVRSKGKVTGLVYLFLDEDDKITDSDIAALVSLCDRIGSALENGRLFEEIRGQKEALRYLAARMGQIEEDQKKRLARDLHDKVGQNLTALGINLNLISVLMPPEPDDAVGRRLEDSRMLVEETTRLVRDVMSDLRPSVLDDFGLVAALRWYGERFSLRTGIGVTVDAEEMKPRMEPEKESVFFRVFQEAMNNVAKHSEAREVKIGVQSTERNVVLIVDDDGKGFDMDTVIGDHVLPTFGVVTMKERMEGINGTARIESTRGKGTRVYIEAPR